MTKDQMTVLYSYDTSHYIDGFKIEVLITSKALNGIDSKKLEHESSECIHKIIHEIKTQEYKKDENLISKVKEYRSNIDKLFENLSIYKKCIPNEYDPSDPYFSLFEWYLVTTKIGTFKVGTRKRVIVVDWSETDLDICAQELFPLEDVTKEGKYIHAWSWEKAKDYVSHIINSFDSEEKVG